MDVDVPGILPAPIRSAWQGSLFGPGKDWISAPGGPSDVKRKSHPGAMSAGISKDQLSCSLIVVEGHLEPSQDASLILNQSRDAGSTPLQLAREREHIVCDWQSTAYCLDT